MNFTCGGLVGYSCVNSSLSSKRPPSQAVPSGPSTKAVQTKRLPYSGDALMLSSFSLLIFWRSLISLFSQGVLIQIMIIQPWSITNLYPIQDTNKWWILVWDASSEEDAEGGCLAHNTSKWEKVIVTWVKKLSSWESGNNSLRDLIVYWNFIIGLFFYSEYLWISKLKLFIFIMFWRKKVVCNLLWFNLLLSAVPSFRLFIYLTLFFFFIWWYLACFSNLVWTKDFFIAFLILSFLFFRLTLDFCKFWLILSIKTFMMKVALRMILTYLMEVVHI